MTATEWIDRAREYLILCPACDGGIPASCTCPPGDIRVPLDRALAALRGVLDEHEPGPAPFGSYRQACGACSDPEVGLTVFHPCATVRAIEEALT